MKFARFIAAAVACVAIGVATPALASSVSHRGAHPNTSFDLDTSGFSAEVYCGGGEVHFHGNIHDVGNTTISGWFELHVDGSTVQAVAWNTQPGSAHKLIDLGVASYSTAYATYEPAGSVWKVKLIRIDFPQPKDCS